MAGLRAGFKSAEKASCHGARKCRPPPRSAPQTKAAHKRTRRRRHYHPRRPRTPAPSPQAGDHARQRHCHKSQQQTPTASLTHTTHTARSHATGKRTPWGAARQAAQTAAEVPVHNAPSDADDVTVRRLLSGARTALRCDDIAAVRKRRCGATTSQRRHDSATAAHRRSGATSAQRRHDGATAERRRNGAATAQWRRDGAMAPRGAPTAHRDNSGATTAQRGDDGATTAQRGGDGAKTAQRGDDSATARPRDADQDMGDDLGVRVEGRPRGVGGDPPAKEGRVAVTSHQHPRNWPGGGPWTEARWLPARPVQVIASHQRPTYRSGHGARWRTAKLLQIPQWTCHVGGRLFFAADDVCTFFGSAPHRVHSWQPRIERTSTQAPVGVARKNGPEED